MEVPVVVSVTDEDCCLRQHSHTGPKILLLEYYIKSRSLIHRCNVNLKELVQNILPLNVCIVLFSHALFVIYHHSCASPAAAYTASSPCVGRYMNGSH